MVVDERICALSIATISLGTPGPRSALRFASPAASLKYVTHQFVVLGGWLHG